MKQLLFATLLTISSLTMFAGGTKSHGSASRPHYSEPKHTESHGGTYSGGSTGSSHKGSYYTAPNGYKGYGTHKK